jgi:subtilisin-like proprotein convertase family protein
MKHRWFSFFFYFFCAFVLPLAALAQNKSDRSFFKPFDEKNVQMRGLKLKEHQPARYDAWELDVQRLETYLLAAPHETVQQRRGMLLLDVPAAGGATETFSVWATDVMAPELQAKFPNIRTFSGQSMEHPGRNITMTLSVRGLHITITRPDMGIEYVETRWENQRSLYMYFDRQALSLKKLPDFTAPDLERVQLPLDNTKPAVENRGSAVPVVLRTLRYTVTPDRGFEQDHGNTKESVMAAIVEYTNRTNVAYERDCAMRLQLVANNDKLVINEFNPIASGDDNGTMAGKNRLFTNTNIGANNYDIGHVYARGGGGVSLGLGIACGSGKAGGCSAGSGGPDYGDSFVGVIGQETGHQLNGAHTWNFCGRGNSQRSGGSAWEPGSGSTIMSYAGLCGPDNVTGTFDLYYHAGSIEEIRGFVDAANCGAASTTTNNAPQASVSYTNGFYIPVNTPFVLVGTGTDPDGDALSYNWEQMDIGTETPVDTPLGNCAIYRTFPSVKDPVRYFPTYNIILTGLLNGDSEKTPTYTRDLSFRFTVRDNHPGAGGVQWADMVQFKTFEGAGPFKITTPNTITTTWLIGEYRQVKWDVKNTDKAPINCSKVNILLSVDGGKTFPFVLASETPNDGSQYVLVPDVNAAGFSATARIRVEAVGNVFLDISDRNFTIRKPQTPSYTLSLSNEDADICLPAVFTSNIAAAGTLGFSDAAALRLEGDLPPGATTSFNNTSLAPGGAAQLSIDLTKVNVATTVNLKLVATLPDNSTIERPITLRTLTNDFSNLKPKTPADGSTGLGLNQTLRWQTVPDAQQYEVQFANSPAFTNLTATTITKADSLRIPNLLEKGKAYFWRIRPINVCGTGAWTTPAFFSTFFENCSVFEANDLPITISANSTPTVETRININAGGTVEKIAVKQIKGNHTYFKDLSFTLTSPDNQQIKLITNKCGNNNIGFDFAITDLAANVFSCNPLPIAGRAYKPESPLSAFAGKSITGPWRLRVNDNTPGSGGSLAAFQLEMCNSVSLNPPVRIKNNVLTLASGTNKAINNDLLLLQDPNNTPAQLVFTLVTVPQNGHLEKNMGGPLKPGDQFTQADIDAGIIRYFDANLRRPEDKFLFIAGDNEGGFYGSEAFIIRPEDAISAPDLQDLSNTFRLSPNPTQGTVWVALDRPVDAECTVTLFSTAGQVLQNAILPSGSDRLSLSLQTLPAGIYWVRLENQYGAGVKKVVKE